MRKLRSPPKLTQEDIDRALKESIEWQNAFEKLLKSCERITGDDLKTIVR